LKYNDPMSSYFFKLPAPFALFYANTKGELLPIAIQLFPKPAEDNPVRRYFQTFNMQNDSNYSKYIHIYIRAQYNIHGDTCTSKLKQSHHIREQRCRLIQK